MTFMSDRESHPGEGSLLIPTAPALVLARLYAAVFKRVVDVVIVLLLAPVAVSVILIFALLVALDGANPFYRQIRVGRNGRLFGMWKLRSMVPDAEALLKAHLAANPDARREWDSTQKLMDDPRITRIGRIIRMTSIDELPQLWNVLTGSMSLVGPRPIMECQRDIYPGKCYFRLRPGLSGLWQISDRHTTDFVERVKYDDAYFQTVSLATDLRILCKTVTVVFRCTGV